MSKIPTEIIDRCFKRLDRILTRKRDELDKSHNVIGIIPATLCSPAKLSVFTFDEVTLFRSCKPRLSYNNTLSVDITVNNAQFFATEFFPNSIHEYNIFKSSIYRKAVTLDIFSMMSKTDCWVVSSSDKETEIAFSNADGDYTKYINEQLSSLFTLQKADKDFRFFSVPEFNFTSFILEMLNKETGNNFAEVANKYFNLNLEKTKQIGD